MNAANTIQLDDLIHHLPVLPHVVHRVIEVIDSEEVTQNQVVDILSEDPGLVTQLLGLANSPFYGLSGKVLSIQTACVILGLHSIRNTLFGLGAMLAFPVDQGRVYDRKALWQHAHNVAGIARFLASRLGIEEGSAFTAGLLHDIGKLVFDDCCHDRLQEVFQYEQDNDCYGFEAEREVFGFDHAMLGAKLAEHWKLPAVVVSAIGEHHGLEPDSESDYTPLGCLVIVSDLLWHALQIGVEDDVLLPPLFENCLGRLGIKWSQIRVWLAEIDALMQSDISHL